MGEVYRARDAKLNRDVAIKVLLPAVASDPDRLARFSREAQVLASLNHPNIAHIYGVEDAAIVMELVEGEDLAQRIARGAIPLDEALPIARQIAEALEAAHEHGIIHRDLKPANIKVRPDGAVKVLDFGLAKAVDPTAGSSATAMNSPTLSIHATQAGIILGTAAYMSPEQARGKTVDKRTDIWALGAVLFEMLTGKRAFPGDDATDTIVAVVSKDPEWGALPANVPPGIRRLLRRALEKDPKRRLDSAGGARLEIDEALSTPAADTDSTKASSALTGWIRLLPWGLIALLVIGLLAIGYPRQAPEARGLVRFTVAPPFGFVRRTAIMRFAISPDGQTVAYTARGPDGNTVAMTRRLDDVETQTVAGSENALAPFWSPDGRSIGFIKDGAVFRSDLNGRAALRLCDVPAGSRLGSSGTWGSAGVIVFSTSAGLMRVPDTGGTPTLVTSLDSAGSEVLHTSPSFLPDGIHFIFLSLADKRTRGTIWATSINDPARHKLTESSGGAVYTDGWLLSTTEGARTIIAQPFASDTMTLSGEAQTVRDRVSYGDNSGNPGFSASASGVLIVDRPPPVVHQLTWVSRDGQILGTLGPAAGHQEFSLAKDERRVVASVSDPATGKRDLWVFEGEGTNGTRLTFQATTSRPMWAPDGRRVYFTGYPNFPLRSLALGATEPEPLDNPGGFSSFQDYTSDGRYFVLLNADIAIQRVGNSSERRVLVPAGQFSASQPRVSPDGRWLALTLSLPAGPSVFVQPFDRAGSRVQVSPAGGSGPMWRADGHELYYEAASGLMALTVVDRDGVPVPSAPQRLFPLRTSGFVINQPHNVEVAANGQKFLVNTIVGDSDNAPLEVTLNWPAGLKK